MKKKVDAFILDDPSEKDLYQALLNKAEMDLVRIYKEEFAFLKDGTFKIVVWYVDNEE